MKNIKECIAYAKYDFINLKSTNTLGMVIVFMMFGVMALISIPEMAFLILVAAPAVFNALFAMEEESGYCQLGFFPAKRSNAVYGRFLLTFAATIVLLVIAFVMINIARTANAGMVDLSLEKLPEQAKAVLAQFPEVTDMFIAAAIFLVANVLNVTSLTLYYAAGPEKEIAYSFAVMGIVAAVGFAVVKIADISLMDMLEFAIDVLENQTLVSVICFAAGVLVNIPYAIIASCLFIKRIYK